MKFLRRVSIYMFSVFLLGLGNIIYNDSHFMDSFVPDAISAATDGTECIEPSWIGCSVGWLEKGYIYDQAKGYYVKGSAVNTTVGTTKAPVTTKPVTTITSKLTNNTTKVPTSVTTSLSMHNNSSATVATTTTKREENQAVANTMTSTTTSTAITTKMPYTKRSRVERTTGSHANEKQNNETFELAFLSELSIGWIAGGFSLLLVMVVEFFVVRAIYKKD